MSIAGPLFAGCVPRGAGPTPAMRDPARGVDAGPVADAAPGADAATADAAAGPDASAAPDAGPTPDAGPVSDAGAVPIGQPAADELRVNETVALQTLDGVGANVYAYPWASDLGWDWARVRWVFDELPIAYVRLASWFVWWETENDDDDPRSIRREGFGTVHDIIDQHDVPFARWLHDRGVEVSLGIWDVGDWLAGGSPRRIPPERYDELGESIAAYVLNMRAAGVPMSLVEVQNEPGIESSIQYPGPEALRDAARSVIGQLDHFQLGDVDLHGPNFHQPVGTADWAEVWLADDAVRARTRALSFHTWWNEERAPYDAIRQVAERWGKPVWATETGYCALPDGCFGGSHYLRPETWGTAWDYALSHYRAIAWAGATRIYLWTLLGNDAAVGPTGERTPSLDLFAHFAHYLPPGARRVETASGDPELLLLAFEVPGGGRSAIVIHTGAATRVVRLRSMRGTAPAPRRAITSTEGARLAEATVGGVDGEGRLELTLPGRSVTSLFF